MDTCSLTQDFLVFLDAEKGYSRLTLQAYASDLSQFWTFARPEHVGTPDDVTTALVRRWIVHLRQQGLASSSIARHLSALRSFWAFLLDNDHVAHDPLRSISGPKRKHAVPTCLTVPEVELILSAAGSHSNPVIAARDFAMMSTLVFTGLRRAELLALKVADVSFETRALHVRNGKGGKDRVLPVTAEVLGPVEDWLGRRPSGKTDALFTTTYGNRIHPTRIQIIWKRVLTDSGITRDGITLHTLRHIFATLLLQNGTDLVSIQKLLHADQTQLREGVLMHPLVKRDAGEPQQSSNNTRVTQGPGSSRSVWRMRSEATAG